MNRLATPPSRKRTLAVIVPLLAVCAVAAVVYLLHHARDVSLVVEMSCPKRSTAKIYFDGGNGLNEEDSRTVLFPETRLDHFQELRFPLPAASISQIRFDPLKTDGSFAIRNVAVVCGKTTLLRIDPTDIRAGNQIAERTQTPDAVTFSTVPGAANSSLSFKLHGRLRLRRAVLLAHPAWLGNLFLILLLAAFFATYFRNQLWTITRRCSVETRCILALCCLAGLVYVPSWLLGLSLNPIFVFSGLTVGSEGTVSRGGFSVDPNTGFTTQALGMLSAHDWLHGIVPWWNSLTGVGMPLAAEMQPSSLFLPFILLLRLATGLIWLKISLQILSGVATFLLLRRLKLSSYAAFVAAALYEFNSAFAWVSHGPIMPVPFLPVLILGIECAFDKAEQQRRGGWTLVVLAVAYSVYAGFPETAYLDGLFAGAWTITRFVSSAQRPAFSRKIGAGTLCGILLSAPVIVPFLEYQRLSALSHFIGSGALRISGFAIYLFPYLFGPVAGFGAFDPSDQLNGHWGVIGGYLGLTALFLLILALVNQKTYRGLRWMLAGWIVLFMARTFGLPGTIALFHVIPGMDVTQIHRYSVPSWELAAVTLAGLAIDDWWCSRRTGARAVLLSALLTVILAGLALWLGSDLMKILGHVPGYRAWPKFSLKFAGIVLAGAVLLLTLRPRPRVAALLGFLLIAETMVFFSIPTFTGIRNAKLDLGPVEFLKAHAGYGRVYSLGALKANYSAYFGFASINHNAVPIPANWTNYIDSSLDPGDPPPLFLGNWPNPVRDSKKTFPENLASFEGVGVKYVMMFAASEPFKQYQGRDRPKLVYLDRTFKIFELPDPAPYFETKDGPCSLVVKSREAVHASCQGKADLLRRELFYPGWQASVNGKSVTPFCASSIFQGINLPAGESQIEFRYRPTYFGWTLSAALLSLLVIVRSSFLALRERSVQRVSA